MAVFASRTKRQIEVGEGDEKGIVTIRKLSARSLEKAREARQLAVVKTAQQFGPEMIKVFRDAAAAAPASPPTAPVPAAQTAEAKYSDYDEFLILTQGVESWTFDIPVAKGLEDLDETTAQLLFRAIVDLSHVGKEEAEKKEKNV